MNSDDAAAHDMNMRPTTVKALGVGVATGAYGLSFGAISIASGLDVWQTQALSLLMFTGASQFALVGVLGAGGGLVAAVATAVLLGARNSLYALSLAPRLQLHGFSKFAGAHVTIDESTAMALSHPDDPQRARHAFWATGLSVFILWNIGTLAGALGASVIDDPGTLGLDAAIPAGFTALLWPRLTSRSMWALALVSASLAIALVPFLQPGLPVLAAALVAVAADRIVAYRSRRGNQGDTS